MYGYIYMTTYCDGKYKYVGKKKSSVFLGEKYRGSGGDYFCKVDNKYSDTARVEMLEECSSSDDLCKREIYWIEHFNAVDDKSFLNVAIGGNGGNLIAGLSEEDYKKHCEKISKAKKGKSISKWSEEQKIKLSQRLRGIKRKKRIREPNAGKKHTEEWKQRHRERMTGEANPFYGKTHTQEVRRLLSERNSGENNPWYGKNLPESIRNSISKSLVGRRLSEEHCKKISEQGKGRRHTEEFKLYMSAINSGESNPMYGSTYKWVTNGTENKRSRSEDVESYLYSGWRLGKTNRKEDKRSENKKHQKA